MNAPISSPTSSSQQSSFASTRQSSSSQIVQQPAPVQIKTPSTDPFLRDFTLVAEAAKRAQMAVLVRDFENIGF
jgi:hypothetical protein